MGVKSVCFILILFTSSVLYNFEIKGTYFYVCVFKRNVTQPKAFLCSYTGNNVILFPHGHETCAV
jgi:hypothetical protein